MMILEDYLSYTRLMQDFLSGAIPANIFAERYADLYRHDLTLHPIPLYHLFDDLLASITMLGFSRDEVLLSTDQASTLATGVRKTLEKLHLLFKETPYLEPVRINYWPDARTIKTRPVELSEYVALIRQFVDHHISADDFETAYVTLFYSDTSERSKEIFWILESLFTDCDAYWPACRPQDEMGERPDPLSASTFHKFAAEALAKLNAIPGMN